MSSFRVVPIVAAALFWGCAAVLTPAPPRYEIVGYYAGWHGDIPFDPHGLTVVNYAFLEIAPDGALLVADPPRDGRNFGRLRAARAVNPQLRLVASVGGWTRSYRFSDMVVDETPRRRFIESTLDFLRRERFDGIDLDWEYPTSIGLRCEAGITCDRATDKANFVLLARELRAALEAAGRVDGKRYLFTIAAGADRKYVFDPLGHSAWLVELAGSLDWINLMTYDYHGTWESSAGLLAPLHRDPADPDQSNVAATVALYLAQGIAPGKLTLGMPFYGKGWVGCSPGPAGNGLYQGCASPAPDPPESTFTFAYLGEQRLVERLGRRWNARARVPYLYDERTGLFVTYEDEASIGEKVRYAREMRLRGAMFWELNADRHGTLAGVVAAGLR